MKSADVAIAGGGMIGLATALELAASGASVTVFDRAEAMSESSRAAAGMLAGTDPENPPELAQLARYSLSLYPDFLERVEQLSGRKIPIRTRSTLQGVRRLPAGAAALPDSDLQRLAPSLQKAGWSFLMIDEQSLDAWDLAEALPSAALAAGVVLREHTAVLGVSSTNGTVELKTSSGTLSAGALVNATGAWAEGIHPGLPVGPRKGHMLTAELGGKIQMQCVLRTPKVYIVPRGNGRYAIGSTVENAGFDKEVHPDQIRELFQRAVDLWPPLRDATVTETWTGLRPGSGDGLPIIDQNDEHCWIATGHFRNGIMLGPGTGRLLKQWILDEEPAVGLSPFGLSRFRGALRG
ncbi:MAG TPA: FAD-dependent oxidoreductase [Acidobacteriaceae bacterium]|nr:FAD-dependent oxidoreductase [Acidobacteriaceae bacterium]